MTEDEFQEEYRQRIARIIAKHEKPAVEQKKGGYPPLTKKEIKMFQSMGCTVTIVKNTTQNSLF